MKEAARDSKRHWIGCELASFLGRWKSRKIAWWDLGSKRNRERGQFEMKERKAKEKRLRLGFEFAGRERSSIESRRYGFCV